MVANLGARMAAYAPLPVRAALAGVFIYTGWKKLIDIDAVVTGFTAIGIWWPTIVAPLVAVAEFFGGLGILTGILPRFSATVLAVVMLEAWWVVYDAGRPFMPNIAFNIVLFAALVMIAVGGTGKATIPQALHRPWLDIESTIGRRPRGAS